MKQKRAELTQYHMFNWAVHSLSDYHVIYYLIKNNAKKNPDYTEACIIEEDYILAYIDLFDVIGRCRFDGAQSEILKMVLWGYTDYEIARALGKHRSNIGATYKTIIGKISEKNDELWRDWLELSGNVKIPPHVTYKRCTRCGKDLRCTPDNYGKDDRIKDGYKSICKRCDRYTKIS